MKRRGLPPPSLIQRYLSSSTTAPAQRHANANANANANAMLPTPVQQGQIRRANSWHRILWR
ncbi:hypothetical protein [Aeromonas veronii]|uniref:hypothetical protein n=1 Tax=Aeromonas veronii TaxID=654 RepID=UPI001117A4A5|nr:hypothetical protein [Aeromonas veronii]